MLTDACARDRDDVLRELAARGISCRRGIPPIHLEPLYCHDRTASAPLPITERVAARSIFLPIFAGLSDGDQQRVIDAVCSLTAAD
jgi:dTDP-4-amino-4,6-dideoxygalactose transaminase